MIRQPALLLTTGEAGARACAVAVRLALRHRSCLTIVHALDVSSPWWAGVGGSVDVLRAREEARVAGERHLAEVRDGLPDELSVRTRLLHAPERVGAQVLRAVQGGAHDLLILEAPSAWPEPGGHAAAWLARHCPVPVLTVPAAFEP